MCIRDVRDSDYGFRNPFIYRVSAILAGSPANSREEFPLAGVCSVSLPLHAGDQFIIVVVRADPEPDYSVAFPYAQSPVVLGYAHRVDLLCRVDSLEAKSGVIRILDKPPVSLPRSIFDRVRQLRESFPKPVGCLGSQSDSGSRPSVSPL